MGPQAANKITSMMTLSERADALEEHMMHELDKIVTKSVFSHMTDGHVDMEGGAALMKEVSGQVLQHGPGPTAASDAGEADPDGLFQEPLRLD